ncbi:MAG: FlgD immunoglobulin-like domain containing protein [Candidatus Zixiibacteriota bacterium]
MKRLLYSSLVFLLTFPLLAHAGAARFFSAPDTSFASNTAIDIIKHHNGVWLATGNGVNYSFDSGASWLLYDSANGLISNDISALLSLNGRLWVASSHNQIFQGAPLSYSDGLSYTDDDGNTWHRMRFDSLTPPLKGAMGAYTNIYDLAGHHDVTRNRDWIFATMWAGGMLASQDNGMSWRRLFPSRADSINMDAVLGGSSTTGPTLANLAFSCVVDTSHGDSLFLWEGTVAGVFQYVFAPRNQKFGTKKVTSVAYCDDCSLAGKSYVFYGGSQGLVRGLTTGGPYITTDTSQTITSVFSYRGRLFFGESNELTGSSSGLYVSDDQGISSSQAGIPALFGTNHRILGFASIRNRLYLAGEQAGLYVSSDTGDSWSQLWVDISDTTAANMRNAVYTLDANADTLRIGTDSGMVTWYLDSTGVLDSSRSEFVPEDTTSFTRVVKIGVQAYHDSLGVYDSSSTWVISRSPDPLIVSSVVSRSTAGGTVWEQYEKDISTNTLAFVGNVAVFGSEYGIRYTTDAFQFKWLRVKDANDTTIVMSDSGLLRARDTVNAIVVRGDTVILAGNRTIARSVDRLGNFRVFSPNLDSLKADLTINYNYANTLNIHDSTSLSVGLTGNFIPALGIQYIPGESARILASGRPDTANGINGVSWGRQVPVVDTAGDTIGYRYRWDQIVGVPTFAWNFDHDGNTVFVPTDSGLYKVDGLGSATVDVTPIVFRDTSDHLLIPEGTAIYTARVIDSFVWVGTDNGTIRINRDNLSDQKLFRVVDPSEEVYAFPVPFAPQEGDKVNFHFTLTRDADVTIEVYDFALNLVARPIDHRHYTAGSYPGTGEVGQTWDGRNGRNDIAAVGVYYFKVTYSTGEVKWGKLAVIP